MTTPDHLKLKALLVILATFALGTVAGATISGLFLQAGTRAYESRGRPDPPVLDNLRGDLKLTDAQATAIRAVTEDMRRELRETRLDRCPGFADARQRLVGRVRALLTPQQQERFDAIVSQRQMRGNFQSPVER
jgi:Spy/CpxP family protein refolding chaperone